MSFGFSTGGKDLATQKLRIAEDLDRFRVDQFSQSRAFLLELAVVVILIVELILLFRGHRSRFERFAT